MLQRLVFKAAAVAAEGRVGVGERGGPAQPGPSALGRRGPGPGGLPGPGGTGPWG